MCAASFDHLVGQREHAVRHGEPECFGSLEVDDHLEFCRLRDGKVAWLFTLENAGNIVAGLSPKDGETRSISHQTAADREFAIVVDRWNRMTCCQCGNSS